MALCSKSRVHVKNVSVTTSVVEIDSRNAKFVGGGRESKENAINPLESKTGGSIKSKEKTW